MIRLRRTSAFTLIELLVVISIIAILVALLLPALSQAKRLSQITQCSATLRQLTTGVVAYATDQDGEFPDYDTLADRPTAESLGWNNRAYIWGQKGSNLFSADQNKRRELTHYVGEVAPFCPLDETGYRSGAGSLANGVSFYERYGTSFLYNSFIYNGVSGQAIPKLGVTGTRNLFDANMSQIYKPSLMALGGDFTIIYAEYFTIGSFPAHFKETQIHAEDDAQTLSMAFVDGHVKQVTMREPGTLGNEHLVNDEYAVINE